MTKVDKLWIPNSSKNKKVKYYISIYLFNSFQYKLIF